MSTSPLRLLVAGLILAMLARAAHVAWHQRALAFAVWRRIGWRQVAGALGLFVLVAGVALTLLESVPLLRYGLGDVVGFQGNAVFAPLEEAAVRAGPAPSTGPDWTLIALTTVFLGPLVLLLPWLAFVEEELFRAGLERTGRLEELWWALRFGLVHLIMLVPLGAALAVGVAGYVYGRIYRRAHDRWDGAPLPEPIARAFRPTKRSRAAAQAARRPVAVAVAAGTWTGDVIDRTPERRQAYGVLTSTVWHTAFNTSVIVLVWVSIVTAAW